MSTAEGSNPSPQRAADDLHVVAPQLRELRRRASLTLEAAARAAGLSPAHLSRLETGQRQPSLPMLLALARIYGTTVSELLGETVAERDAVVRAADMEPTAAGGWTYWQAGASGRGMQALRVHVPYGSQGDIVRVHPGEEWLHVLRGGCGCASVTPRRCSLRGTARTSTRSPRTASPPPTGTAPSSSSCTPCCRAPPPRCASAR